MITAFIFSAVLRAQNAVPSPATLKAVAGTIEAAYHDGRGGVARFDFPYAVAADAAGTIYVADSRNQVIRKINSFREVTTFAGSAGEHGDDDGVGASARFSSPQGIAVDALGNIYVTDTNNETIRKITAGGMVSTLAGTAGITGFADGLAKDAQFDLPSGIAVDPAGNIFVADSNNQVIRKISSAGMVTTFAGGAGIPGSNDGAGIEARFSGPQGVAVDLQGNVYVADTNNHTIRKITPSGDVTTIAGAAGDAGSNDGAGTQARFRYPFGIAVAPSGNLYVTDTWNHALRIISPEGLVTTVRDNVSGGANQNRAFSAPRGVAIDAAGFVFVADTAANTVRSDKVFQEAATIATQPLSRAVFVGDSVTWEVTVEGNPVPTYQWQKNGIDIPGATSATLTLNNIQLSDAGSYALVATNLVGGTTSRFARLVVLVPKGNATTYSIKTYPTGVTAGGNVSLEYGLTNIGTQNWGANHFLSIRDSEGKFVAFASLIGTAAGEDKIANINFPAPTIPGVYTYTVQGYEGGVEFFDTQTTFTLTVLAQAANSITYNATNFPVTATPGSHLIFSYNVTNTGTKSWGTGHFLSLRDGASRFEQFSSLNGVAPGQSKTVNLSFTAPSKPGIYPYYVQALENGVEFFTAQANVVLTVLAPQPNAIVYTKTRSQDNVVSGATVNLRYLISNAGTGTWGPGHYISLRDGSGTYLAFVPVNGVAPGGNTTVDFSFVAPDAPGAYAYVVQAFEDGVEFFDKQDQVTFNVLALPIANAATYETTNFPSTVSRGAKVTFTYSLTNRGTKDWGATHFLALRDADSTFLGFPSLNGTPSGGSKTVSYSFTAPTEPGVYTYHVQGMEGGLEFFGEADDLVLTVP